MDKFWKRASIIDVGRASFESSVKLIDAAKERIEHMDADSDEVEERLCRLSRAVEDGTGWNLRNVQSADVPAVRNESSVVYKQINTNQLPEILSAAKISFPEFWKICYGKELIALTPEGTDPEDPKYKDLDHYIPKDVSDMYRIIDGLDAEKRKMVGDIAMTLTPTFWHTDLDEMYTIQRQLTGDIKKINVGENPYRHMGVTGRVWALIRRKFKDQGNLNQKASSLPKDSKAHAVVKQMQVRRRAGLSVTVIPLICNIYGISAHHIFNLPDNVKLYAKESGTEQIITAYMFMGESNKEIFREMLRKEEAL